MQNGLFLRRFTVRTAGGSVQVEAERFVSLAQKELLAVRYSLTPDYDAHVVMRPYLDANVRNLDSNYDETFWDMLEEEETEDALALLTKTKENPFGTPRFAVSAAMSCWADGLEMAGRRLDSGYVETRDVYKRQHADWCEMTMSMMREKQFEACERRLFAHPGVGLFAPEATEADAQALLAGSFDDVGGKSRHTLATLEGLRAAVMERLPKEALYISAGEMQLVERLLINDGELLLGDWDDLGAAEALVSRLWCSFHAEGDDWTLLLPQALHDPLARAIAAEEAQGARERLLRYDATIHGPVSYTHLDVYKRQGHDRPGGFSLHSPCGQPETRADLPPHL